ncbi:MAG: hypothetical protein ACYDAL_15110 [Candidatus Dormibacteraceae bacterium]
MSSRASCVAGTPVQLACMAAQAGTATGLARGGGDGLGVGVGVGDGLGLELGEGLGEGLECATTGPLAVQPAMASSAQTSINPFLTWD